MLASSLAILFSKEKEISAVDCDVDTPNLHLWLNEVGAWKKSEKVSVAEKPEIDNSKVENPKECVQKCRFNALKVKGNRLELNPFLCEGCGACEIFCPPGAIRMKRVNSGEIRTKETKYSFPLIAGSLFPGETGSGKLVSEVKREADKLNKKIQIIDTAPGAGCPVIASLKDVDFILLVTEPTPSGLSDLKKSLEVVNYFKIPWKLIINKWDVNRKMTEEISKEFTSKLIGKISFDKKIINAISNLIPLVETELKAKREVEKIYKKVKEEIKKS